MSKPLELTVYPKSVGRHGEAVYVDEAGQWTYPVSHVDGYAQDKRFTDTELAAEWWHANWHKGRRVDPRTYAWEWEHAIVYRFATLPSYDEVA